MNIRRLCNLVKSLEAAAICTLQQSGKATEILIDISVHETINAGEFYRYTDYNSMHPWLELNKIDSAREKTVRV